MTSTLEEQRSDQKKHFFTPVGKTKDIENLKETAKVLHKAASSTNFVLHAFLVTKEGNEHS